MDASDGNAPFSAYADLLQLFVANREELVERIQALLNAQYKPERYLRDRDQLCSDFEGVFYSREMLTDAQCRLRGQLDEAHHASGFRPRAVEGLHNDLIAPAEMMIRAFYCWQQTRWPTRKLRTRYAHTLFDVFLLRNLQLLGMRLWDNDAGSATERLAQLQALLDALNVSVPQGLPVHVRDARWLIPLALSPTTDELGAYFAVAENIGSRLESDDCVETCKASVQMIGGHLRSQIRHYCLRDRLAVDDPSVILRTRTSNALDLALLIQGLVPLLRAYENAQAQSDDATRLSYAGAILQGISPDPELFLNRLDLLFPYSMIDYLFVDSDSEGNAHYTAAGQRHVDLFREYEALIARHAAALRADSVNFEPTAENYSPYGAIYGTPSNLLEHISLKTVAGEVTTQFSLHDVFTDGDARKLVWVNSWRKLPHIPRDIEKQHRYPQPFAAEMFARIALALQSHSADRFAGRTGQLFVETDADTDTDTDTGGNPRQGTDSMAVQALPPQYVFSSDSSVVNAGKAQPAQADALLRDSREGHFLVSYETESGRVAITKDFLTELLGEGTNVAVNGLPKAPASALRLLCAPLV